MEDFPANLDDGELWLPSDIFPTEEPHHQHQHRHHNPLNSFDAFSMNDLNRHFNNFNFIHHHQPSFSQRLGVYEAMTQCAVTTPTPTPTPNGCFGLTVGPNRVDHGLFNFESGPVYPIPDLPAHHFPMHKPVRHQVAEQLMETRIARNSRPVRRQQHNRPFPLQASGFGLGLGLMRDCRSSSTSFGTGVFIPRTNSHPPIRFDGVKNMSGVALQRGAGRKVGTGKAEEKYCCKLVGSSEVGLPTDWTY